MQTNLQPNPSKGLYKIDASIRAPNSSYMSYNLVDHLQKMEVITDYGIDEDPTTKIKFV